MPDIKIAYLILAHTDPMQLKRLVQSLSVKNRTAFYIHIDAKVNQQIFEQALTELSQVEYTFIKERIKIFWGGYSICIAEENLMKAALNSQKHFSHFALLSGLDYPLWPVQKIIGEIAKFPQREWMSVYNLSLIKTPKRIPKRISSYHFRDFPLKNELLRHYIIGGLMIIMNSLPIQKKKHVKIDNQYYPIYAGSQWWILTRECVKYIIHTLETNIALKRYFRYTLAPDELMIQTIVSNSNFKKQLISCSENGVYPGLERTTFTHYIKYDANGQHIFTASDYKILRSSGKMFCRKLTSGKSDSLIHMIMNNPSF